MKSVIRAGALAVSLLLAGCPEDAPPIADFEAATTSGDIPLTVAFRDLSSPGGAPITIWNWSFGDGETSLLRNPSHTYTRPGTFTVSLRVVSEFGESVETKVGAITVTAVVQFADAALESAVRTAISLPSGTLRNTNLSALTALSAGNAGIRNLAGLDWAVNLESLSLPFNSISGVGPLAGLTKLRRLNLHDNAVAQIGPLAGLVNLTDLDLSLNTIADVGPLAGIVRLETLNLAGNEAIVDIAPLEDMTSLRVLNLTSNQIGDISPLGRMTRMERLSLTLNAISDITVLANMPNLTRLDAAVNPITDLQPIQGLTRLVFLSLFQANISDLTPLLGLTALRELSLSTNQIVNIGPLERLVNLRLLTLQFNQISDARPLLRNGGLGVDDVVRLSGNPLSQDTLCNVVPALLGRGVLLEFDGACAIE